MTKQTTQASQTRDCGLDAPVDFYTAKGYNSENSAGYLMRRIMLMIVTQVDKRLDAIGLTQAQWGPLFLIQQGRATTLAELSREMQIDAGALTRTLDRLEAKGLCKRERSTVDRRVVHLAVTPEGAAVTAGVPEVLADVHNHLLAGFSKDEWETLMGLLRRMVVNAEAMRDGQSFAERSDQLSGSAE